MMTSRPIVCLSRFSNAISKHPLLLVLLGVRSAFGVLYKTRLTRYIKVCYLQSPAYRSSDSGRLLGLYVGRVISFFLSQTQILGRPWADFHETLSHDAVFPEIFYLLHGFSYVPPKKFEGRKTPIFANLLTQNRHFEPSHSLMRGNRKI